MTLHLNIFTNLDDLQYWYTREIFLLILKATWEVFKIQTLNQLTHNEMGI